jgi:hypothetical protein
VLTVEVCLLVPAWNIWDTWTLACWVSGSPDDDLLVDAREHLALEGDAAVAHPRLGLALAAEPVAAAMEKGEAEEGEGEEGG